MKGKRRESPPAGDLFQEPVLTSASLAAALSALLAALLTATLLFTLALLTFTLLTFTLLSLAILLLSALLAGRVSFSGFVWILLCVHDAFLYYCVECLGPLHCVTAPF
jgi:hypothetical protein